jgi:hypothetical protein
MVPNQSAASIRGVYPPHMGKSFTPTSLLYSGDYRCRCTRQYTYPRSKLPQLQLFMSSDSTKSSSSGPVSLTHHLSASSEASALHSLLGDAVEKYKNQVGTSLIENQLATRLEICNSVESVAVILEERVQVFREFLGRDRHPKMITSIKRVVHVLHTISTGLGGAVQVGHGISSIVRNLPMVSVFLISGAYFHSPSHL